MSGRGLCTRLHVLGCRLTYSAWTEQHVRSRQTHFLGDGDGFPRAIKASPARGENPGGVTPRLLHPLLTSRKSSPEAGREALQTLGVVRASHPNKPGPAHLHLRPWLWAAQHGPGALTRGRPPSRCPQHSPTRGRGCGSRIWVKGSHPSVLLPKPLTPAQSLPILVQTSHHPREHATVEMSRPPAQF